jgi:zinc protease
MNASLFMPGGRIFASAIVLIVVLGVNLAANVGPAGAISIQRVVSEQGIEAWLVEDRSVPVLAVRFAFRGGAALDAKGKEGLADMVSSLLDEGAGPLDSQAFQGRLEDQSISLGFMTGLDNFGGSLRTLSANRAAAFDLLRLALTRPRFDAEPMERIRAQILSHLARSAEQPRSIASRTWYKAAFPDHPYGRPAEGTPESVKRITARDLKDFVTRRLGRDNLMISVVGDISAKELAPLLDLTFGGLPARAQPFTVAEVAPTAAGEMFVIEKNIPQSVVLFGHSGIKRNDPDYYAAYVMIRILGGGGFTSRLTEEIREKRGLAYSVYSYLSALDRAGLIMGGVATANDRVAKSVELIRAEWAKMMAKGVTYEELADAKTYLTGSFFTRLNSTRRIASVLLSVQLDRLGIDYLERRNALIEAVGMNDIKRVAKRLLDPAKLTFVVVGTPKGVKPTREAPGGKI